MNKGKKGTAGRDSRVHNSKMLQSTLLDSAISWHSKLQAANVYQNSYTCDLIFVVETDRAACQAVNELKRKGVDSKFIKFITPKELMIFLTDANNPQIKNTNNYTSYYRDAFINIQTEFLNNGSLSTSSLASLIKLRIIAHNEEIAAFRQMLKMLKKSVEDELKKAEQAQSGSVGKGKDKKGKKEKASAKGKKKGDAGATDDDKYKKMNKDDNYPGFVDAPPVNTIYNFDYNEPQPKNIFFIACGFYDPELLSELDNLKVDVTSFIEVGSDQTFDEVQQIEEEDEMEYFIELEKTLTSVKKFWKNINKLSLELSDVLSEKTCYMKYNINDSNLNNSFNIYEDFEVILKNLTDFKRLYSHYFQNVRFLDVEEIMKPVSLTTMHAYNAYLDRIPNECITVPLMLHALLDEVCVRVDKISISELDLRDVNTKPMKKKKHGGTTKQIKSLLKDYEYTYKKSRKIIKMPNAIHLSYGNVLEYVNGHVPIMEYVNVTDITLNGFQRILPLRLFNLIKNKNIFDLMFYKYAFAKWSDHLQTVTVQELTQCVYAYLFTRGNFRSMENIKTSRRLSSLVRNINQLMFGVKKVYNEAFKCPKVILDRYCRVDSQNSCDTCCAILPAEYCTLAEEFDNPTLIQIIHTAYDDFKHFDYKYFGPLDVILLRFHHDTDEFGVEENINKIMLRTPLCFRDFCSKILSLDIGWFVDEEKKFWDETYANIEKEKELMFAKPVLDDILKPADFIIEGSLKFELLEQEKAEKKGKGGKNQGKEKKSGGKEPKSKEGKGKKGGKNETAKGKDLREDFKSPQEDISIPINFPPFDVNKVYSFEMYNLGSKYFLLLDEQLDYFSVDGLTVSIKKQKWTVGAPITYSFNISANDTNLILNCYHNKFLIPVKSFNIQTANNIIMVFAVPEPPTIQSDSKHILTNNVNVKLNSVSKSKPTESNVNMFEQQQQQEMNEKLLSLKNSTLEYLKIAVREEIPVFKIISSKLHKYQYVKRIKSCIQLPIGNIFKRVCCKPKLFSRVSKNKNVYQSKCVPYSDMVNEKKCPMELIWSASLPTGLSVKTVQPVAPQLFYIKQKYITERKDMPSIADEAYRCYLRCGIIMKFMKDGSIKTLSPDKTLSHYQYGFFSSNKRRASRDNIFKNIRLKRATNIIPLHAYKKNLTTLERKIRNICSKYKTHLIDISDNYRFESSRLECRKQHNIYNLSKKLYKENSHVIPLINYNIITATGREVFVKNNVLHDMPKKFEEVQNKDYLLNETILHREDGTSWLLDNNGNTVTQFPDGSRIKSWCTILNEYLLLEESVSHLSVVASDDTFNKVSQTDNPEESLVEVEDESFILIGMNYTFEHPNFMTVSYYCEGENSVDILMPDDVQLKASSDGTFRLELPTNDKINIKKDKVQFDVFTNINENLTNCCLNLSVFNKKKLKPEDIFISAIDSTKKEFKVTCSGAIIKKDPPSNNNSTIVSSESQNPSPPPPPPKKIPERLFVLNRDLTGQELSYEPLTYRFIHTLANIENNTSSKNFTNIRTGPTKTRYFKPLHKTYSEHLMMLYDIPVLATTREKCCIDKLWKLHDLDINTIILKRKPLFVFERVLSHLPSFLIMEELAQAVLRCIVDGTDNLPNINLVQELSQTEDREIEFPDIDKKPKRKYSPKRFKYKKLQEKYRGIIKENTIPDYFETLKGLMFLTVEECSEGAMSAEDGPRESRQVSRMKSLQPPITGTVSKLRQTYKSLEIIPEPKQLPSRLQIPDNLTIHLKPDSTVYDIIFTSTGIKIITDHDTQHFKFPELELPTMEKSKPSLETSKAKKLVEFGNSDNENSIQKFLSSRLTEEQTHSYEDSSFKLPSWNSSACQKSCFIDSSNTLSSSDHYSINKCTNESCRCPPPSVKNLSIHCRCLKSYCNCHDTYTMFSTCAMQNELKISEFTAVLGWNVVETFETNPSQYNILQMKLDKIVKDTAKKINFPELNIFHLIKTIRWIITNKTRIRKLPPLEKVQETVKQIEFEILTSVYPIDAQNFTPAKIGKIQYIANTIQNQICSSENLKETIVNIKKIVFGASLATNDMLTVFKIALEKINDYYEFEVPKEFPKAEITKNSSYAIIIKEMQAIVENLTAASISCEKCSSTQSKKSTSKQSICDSPCHISSSNKLKSCTKVCNSKENILRKGSSKKLSTCSTKRSEDVLPRLSSKLQRSSKIPSKEEIITVTSFSSNNTALDFSLESNLIGQIPRTSCTSEQKDKLLNKPNIYDAKYLAKKFV